MKNKIRIIGTFLLAITIMVSCVDDTPLTFDVTKPASIMDLEYLDEYDVLKSYISSNANPNFKLGIALEANDYIAGGVIARLANSNFHEMTAGNAMKYASCVADNGSMNFGTVEKFVAAAKAEGMTIYGHTLAWHAQQNNKYLNSLIKDKELEIDPDASNEVEDYLKDYSLPSSSYNFWNSLAEGASIGMNTADACLEIVNPTPVTNYFVQYHTADGLPTEKGKRYKLTMKIKGSANGRVSVGVGPWSGRAEGNFDFNTEWKEYTMEFNAVDNGGHVMTQSGAFAGTIQIKWVKISHSEAPAITFFVNQIVNSKMEVGEPMNNFVVRESGKPDASGTILVGQGPDGTNCIKLTSVSNPANPWDTQFFIYTPNKVWEAGQKYRISFWYKASAEADCATQTHIKPGEYKHWSMLPGNPHFTTEWQHYEATSTIPGEGESLQQTIAFNLNENPNAITYYFANIVWETEEKSNTIPLTPEEKKDTLTWAMNNWIEGMMKATGGYVTAWDVVNEAITGGGDDGEGNYPLHSTTNVSADDARNNFYWQDYLGSLDYVRIAVAAARRYYAENGGTEPLRLFINDYNLESDWDNNKKVKSLINWIEKWESDKVTVIDGIGTQMHLSYFENTNTQKSKEDHIVNMFQLLKESGKLIKITELDMGYVDANGASLKTESLTEEQHKAMAEYYKFIVKKYFEIIPVPQQYGITQWCLTDSPANSGWRGGEPVGIWDLNYNRKHVYAGFAAGLAGKD